MKRFHIIKVSFISATDNEGHKMKLYSGLNKETVILWKDNTEGTDQAVNYLERKGHTIVGKGNGGTNADYIVCEGDLSIK